MNLLFLFNILKKRSGSKAAFLVLLYVYYSRYSDNYIYQYYKAIEDIKNIPENVTTFTIKL